MIVSGNAILPIFAALSIGYVGGRRLTPRTRSRLGKLISPLVWLLLFSIGVEFGGVLRSASRAAQAIETAILFASLTTLIPWILILLFRGRPSAEANSPRVNIHGFAALAKPLKECAISLLMVGGGVLLSIAHSGGIPLLSTSTLLYALIWLVGVDIVDVRLSWSWLSVRTLLIPALVVVGSLMGGIVASRLADQPIETALALSSGFGWFTLSGVLVGKHLGDAYGTIALLTDLFRELIAIVLLYSMGMRYSRACIGASGATALDSTLPIIKQTCNAAEVPTALVSGFILTLLAPFLISFFLAK